MAPGEELSGLVARYRAAEAALSFESNTVTDRAALLDERRNALRDAALIVRDQMATPDAREVIDLLIAEAELASSD